jgi:hypothetical protein
MVAGIPGAGIGGLFYLLSAFMLPVRLLRRWTRGERRGLRLTEVLVQILIAAGIIGGIWITGWLLGVVAVHSAFLHANLTRGALRGLPGAAANVVRMATLLAGFITLAFVLATVELGRFAFVRRRVRAAPWRTDGGANGRYRP